MSAQEQPRRLRPAFSFRDHAGSAGSFLGHVAAVVLGCVLLFFGATQAPPAWSAAHADGVRGVLTITDAACGGKGGCSRRGNFRSEEGYINLEGVDLVGAGGDEGDRVPAFYEGDTSQVYGYGWRGVLEAVLLASGGITFILYGIAPFLEGAALRRHPPTGRHARSI